MLLSNLFRSVAITSNRSVSLSTSRSITNTRQLYSLMQRPLSSATANQYQQYKSIQQVIRSLATNTGPSSTIGGTGTGTGAGAGAGSGSRPSPIAPHPPAGQAGPSVSTGTSTDTSSASSTAAPQQQLDRLTFLSIITLVSLLIGFYTLTVSTRATVVLQLDTERMLAQLAAAAAVEEAKLKSEMVCVREQVERAIESLKEERKQWQKQS